MIFETHAHYDDHEFDADREELLTGLQEAGIGRVVNIGCDLASCESTLKLTEQYDFIYGAVGIHPDGISQLSAGDISRLEKWCGHEKCVAVGEIGLDYHRDDVPRALQKDWFAAQLELARSMKLPAVIHSRDAARDTLDIMRGERAGEIGGVLHCYNYAKETARDFLDMGFYFGIGGVLTFKNGRKLKEAVEYLPFDRIVVETDSPYLSPEPYRGRRNSSLNLPYIIEALAQLKGVTPKEAEDITWANACRLYGMEEKDAL